MDNANAISQEGFPTLDEHKNEQLTLFSLQELAVKSTVSIIELQRQLREATEMYKDMLQSSNAYSVESKRLKEQRVLLQSVKQELEKTPEGALYLQKIKDLKFKLKDKKMSVSDFALQVLKLSGQNEFEKNGEVFQIHTIAKLIRRKQ